MTGAEVTTAMSILTELLRTKELRTKDGAPPGYSHTISVKDAAYVADISESRMRERCEANSGDLKPGRYARRERGGAWMIEVLPFLQTLPLNLIPRFRHLSRSRTGLSAAPEADALEIEAGAKRRLADEYDAAQERGEIRTQASNKASSKLEEAGVADVGLTHKEIHEARIIRDAEVAEPGIVRR